MSSSNEPAKPIAAQHCATGRNNTENTISAESRKPLDYNELSQQRMKAIELLLRGLSDAEVGAELGVDRGTVYRWRRSPGFAMELERQRRAMFDQSVARVQSMLDPVLDLLQRQLAGDDPKIALRAAAILLHVAMPARMQRLHNPQAAPRRSRPAPAPAPATASEAAENFDRALRDYINAPLPDGSGAGFDIDSLPDGEDEMDEEDSMT
jgi:hypothetical protein